MGKTMLAAATLPQVLPPGHNESWPLNNVMHLRATPRGVSSGRHFVALILRRWNFPEQFVTDAEIVTSELVTNAVQACMGSPVIRRCVVQPVTLAIRSNFGYAVVEVGDPVPEPPKPREHDLDEDHTEGGYGLHLIAFFSESWGYYASGGRKYVWACFKRLNTTE